jgi:hypothetical protein
VLSPTSEVFEELGRLVLTSPPPSPRALNAKVKRIARDFRLRATQAEVKLVRFVLNELAAQLDVVIAEAEEASPATPRKSRGSSESAAAATSTEGFLSSAEMQQRLSVKRQALSVAVKAGRLFAIVGPSGDNFYPSYYADPSLDRRVLEKVSKALGTLPAAAKHRFFTANSSALQGSALEALRNGRVSEVMAAAQAFLPR